ncbi:phosphonate metabolism protein/1,5-bisphosphokinase (PRPP-forming) PhnN [Cohaesibacter haloalkalitolerans]|uniref:phosphonate metabolism protein/1,5-bisphosphokinase (PRPP-forming) PhnN n=1 Tax=Cohaesibacter haloalkalitolerans TaxID=1162980 RepID=UPI001FE03C1B|nr:phosphonate metabolism protein/1,5-bisphosphokinase (PRPP-forming) PhnN [Cohaesibacter haloalkalitolerans]
MLEAADMGRESRQEKAVCMNGRFILLVGPSGAGKDSLLDYAKARLKDDPRILFVRRCITRQQGDPSEDHESMSIVDFQKAEMQGRFVISWGAHGLYYGLPVSMLDHLAKGGVAIANGSRKTIPQLKPRFPDLMVVNLTVEADILARRLAQRGRESAQEIEKRLQRTKALAGDDLFGEETVHLDNSGSLSVAGEALVDLLRQWAD